jgi:hypothetical protein
MCQKQFTHLNVIFLQIDVKNNLDTILLLSLDDPLETFGVKSLYNVPKEK